MELTTSFTVQEQCSGGGEMVCAAVIIASWHDQVIDN